MKRGLFLLLMPKLLTAINCWKRRGQYRFLWLRNALLLALTTGVMVGSYYGGLWVLRQTDLQLDFAYLHPSVILGLILVVLLLMLVATNCAGALGAFFYGKDLDLVLSSPMPPQRFFFGKWIDVILSSSWMTIVFLSPIVLVFGRHYHGSWKYYLLSIAVFVPFFLIPAAVAVVIAFFVALLIPVQRRREASVVSAGFVLLGLYLFIRLLTSRIDPEAPIDVAGMLRVFNVLSLANAAWSPSHWVAASLGEVLAPQGLPLGPLLLLLYSTTAAAVALAFLVVRLCHFPVYSTVGARPRKNRARKTPLLGLSGLWGILPPPARGLVLKEFRTAARDVTQGVQVLFLLGLSAIYVYLLNFQNLFQQVIPLEQQCWWRLFLIVTNICVEAFVITAMGTRLVFPSISREGACFWVVKNAPVDIGRVLWTKYIAWLVAIALITNSIFAVAAYILHGSLTAVILKLLLNTTVCIGLVGLGMGLGAYFADFNWQHPAELISGFGSLVYMLVGVALIALTSLLAVFSLLFIFLPEPLGPGAVLAGIGSAAAIPVANVLIAMWALELGRKKLESLE